MRLSDLKLNEDKLKKFDPTDPPHNDYEGFVDEESGVSVRTHKGIVQIVNYFATAKDARLCPNYYATPKWFCSILLH